MTDEVMHESRRLIEIRGIIGTPPCMRRLTANVFTTCSMPASDST